MFTVVLCFLRGQTVCFFYSTMQFPISCVRWILKGLSHPSDIMLQGSCGFVESSGFGSGSPNDVLSGGYGWNEKGKNCSVQPELRVEVGEQSRMFLGSCMTLLFPPLFISMWPMPCVGYRAMYSSYIKLWYCLIAMAQWIQLYFAAITS